MKTPLNEVYEILKIFKSQDVVFSDETIPYGFCRVGVIQASIALKKDFIITKEGDEYFIEDINQKEIYLAGLYAYRNFALQTHDDLKRKAINFKTISFAVSGLTERAKEVMRTVWWCDNEINKTLQGMLKVSGYSQEMSDGNGY